MNFEQELQALVDKYNIEEIEVSYKKKTTFRALPLGAQGAQSQQTSYEISPKAILNMDDPLIRSVREEQADPNLQAYLGGSIGQLNT